MNRPRASACRNAPPAEWKSRSVAEGRRIDRASAPSRYGQRGRRTERTPPVGKQALAWAEWPPLWGSDDVSAMRNYRYRHRDSPYVAKRSGERTSRAGRPWAVGGELPGARWRGRPMCAMRPAVQGAAAAQTRACRFFSSTSHPRLRRAGRRRGGKADRSVQRPVILVRCVGHGGGARGVGAVGRHARGGARGTGRAGQRGACAGRET